MAWGYFNHGSHTHCVPCRVRSLKTLNLGLIWSLPVLSALTAPSELSLSLSLFLPPVSSFSLVLDLVSLTEAAVRGQGEGTFGTCPSCSELGRGAQVPIVFVGGWGRRDDSRGSSCQGPPPQILFPYKYLLWEP